MKTGWVLIYGVLCGLLISGLVNLASRPRDGKPVELKALPTEAPIQVQVSGQVRQPGVVTLPPGSRVLDAVALAGGLSEQADQQAVNLARRLKDGENVYVPALGEAAVRFEPVSGLGSLVDINRATQDQLESLPGIGPATALAILQYRLEHGAFQAVDDLDDVPGIGPATVENLRNLVTVGP